MVNFPEREKPSVAIPFVPLQVSSLNLHLLLDLSPDALVIVDQAGMIVMVNEQVETVFGYTHAELVGQPLECLLPHQFRQAHIAHREHYFHTPRTRPMGMGLHLLGQRKDGTEVPVEISLRPVYLDGVSHAIGAIRDVTPQRLAEQERLHQLQRIRQQTELINRAHDAILVLDPTSHIISWNQGAEHLYGWTSSEVNGLVSYDLLRTRFPLGRAALTTLLEQEGQWEGELTHTCRDGRPVVVESRQLLVRDEVGAPQAVLEIDRDITERLELERRKDEFIGMAGHELKTPVTSIKTYVQVLQERLSIAGDEASATVLAKVDTQLTTLTHLINELLDVTKMTTGILSWQEEQFDLEILLQEVVEDLQQTTARHQICRRGTGHVHISADRERIGQVLANLLSNAIKYTPQGGTITLGFEVEEQRVQLRVQDCGIGIPIESQPYIFDRFFRASSQEHETFPGLGLGLYLAAEIIKRLEGKIWVESQPGAGSTFFVTLPLQGEGAGEKGERQ